jgi:hypothetical protein
MSQIIVYANQEGGVSIIHPAPEMVAKFGMDAIAKKDVPSGVKYKILDVSEIPADRSLRNAWVVDEADLTDGIGSVHNTFEGVLNAN